MLRRATTSLLSAGSKQPHRRIGTSATTRSEGTVVVETTLGKLRGSVARSCLGDRYYSFRGVPYARPPVGALRFRPPEAAPSWPGVRDALRHGPKSVQYDPRARGAIGSEDCLYANVYTKRLDGGTAGKPVMVWIHGGAFYVGSGDDDLYAPDYLVSKDVVLVTFNYRLGVLGYLNVEHPVSPGNQGLKDQILLLQWVRRNIGQFGGDPTNVTLFGNSAGSMCIQYLAVSPLARGLFHKAICQSGSILASWAAIRARQRDGLDEMLERLGCDTREPTGVVEFLRRMEPGRLLMEQQRLCGARDYVNIWYRFIPTMDDRAEVAVLPRDPTRLIREGLQLPMILGTTDAEMLFTLDCLEEIGLPELDRDLRGYFDSNLSRTLDYYGCTLEELRKLYLGDEPITESNMKEFIRFKSDVSFVENCHRLVGIQARCGAAPTYLYRFAYGKGDTLVKRSLSSGLAEKFKRCGASHEDELTYLFRQKLLETEGVQQLEDGKAEQLMRRMVEMWCNFARTGVPTPEVTELIPTRWKPVNDENLLRYLNIDEDLEMRSELNLAKVYSKDRR